MRTSGDGIAPATGQQSLLWQALLAIAFVSIAALMAARERTAWMTYRPGDLVTEPS